MISPSVWWLLVAVYDQTEHKWRSLQCIPANMVSFKLSILPDLPLPYQVWGMSSCRSWDWRKVSFCRYSMNYSKLSPVQSSSWVPSKTICRCWKSRKVLLYLFLLKIGCSMLDLKVLLHSTLPHPQAVGRRGGTEVWNLGMESISNIIIIKHFLFVQFCCQVMISINTQIPVFMCLVKLKLELLS